MINYVKREESIVVFYNDERIGLISQETKLEDVEFVLDRIMEIGQAK